MSGLHTPHHPATSAGQRSGAWARSRTWEPDLGAGWVGERMPRIRDNAKRFYEHYGLVAPRPGRLVRKASNIEADIKTV